VVASPLDFGRQAGLRRLTVAVVGAGPAPGDIGEVGDFDATARIWWSCGGCRDADSNNYFCAFSAFLWALAPPPARFAAAL